MTTPKFVTERETVVGEVTVWAAPRTEWEVQRSKDKRLFKYTIEDYCVDRSAVKVHVAPVTVVVPEGVNLLEKALETLDEKAAQAYKIYQDALNEIEQQRNRLKLLAFDPGEPSRDVAEQELIL